MGIISNVKESLGWVAGAALEPVGKLLTLNIGGAIGSVFRIPSKLMQSGASLFGKSSVQTQRASQEALRRQYPNGSPGSF